MDFYPTFGLNLTLPHSGCLHKTWNNFVVFHPTTILQTSVDSWMIAEIYYPKVELVWLHIIVLLNFESLIQSSFPSKESILDEGELPLL